LTAWAEVPGDSGVTLSTVGSSSGQRQMSLITFHACSGWAWICRCAVMVVMRS
jgi:hypothetical protein